MPAWTKVWENFLDIIGDLKLDFLTEEPIKQLTVKIKSCFQHFLDLYQAKDVTPYACLVQPHSRIFDPVHKHNVFQPARDGNSTMTLNLRAAFAL